MNQSELIDYIAEQTGLTKADAARALKATIGGITLTLTKGGEVSISDFGKFGVTRRKATKGRNPQTGEEIKIPARTRPVFRCSKKLKDVVDK